jgi:hypothetical protein
MSCHPHSRKATKNNVPCWLKYIFLVKPVVGGQTKRQTLITNVYENAMYDDFL